MGELFAKVLILLILAAIITVFIHAAHHNDAYNDALASYGAPIPPPSVTDQEIQENTNRRCGWVLFHPELRSQK